MKFAPHFTDLSVPCMAAMVGSKLHNLALPAIMSHHMAWP